MAENQKEALIKKLAAVRENLDILQNMLKKEQRNIEQKLQLTAEAKQSVNDILYELTGNEFYRNA